MRRHATSLGFGLLLLVVAGAAAAGVVVVGARGDSGLSRTEYIARVNDVCAVYGARLDEIRPPDVTIPADVVETVGAALPIVAEEYARVREIPVPRELRRQVGRFLSLSDDSVARLREVLRWAYRRNVGQTGLALFRFEDVRNEAQVLGRRIGFRC